MRTLLFAVASALLALVASPTDASADRWHHGHHRHHHHHGGWGPRVSIGVGPGWWWPGVYVGAPYRPYRPYYAYGPYPAPYPYWAPPARVVVEDPDPPVYVERGDDAPSESYWYYCESRRAYYPKVETCPERWIPVPANDR